MNPDEIRQLIINTMETSLEIQLLAIRKMKGEDEEPVILRRSGRRRQSIVDVSIDILTERGKSLHVNEICQILLEKHGRVTDRDTLSSSLGKKARQGILLRKAGPATFDLIDREADH